MIYFVGNDHVYQYHWKAKSIELNEIQTFKQRYRNNNDGTYVGISPIYHNDAIYLTTNAYPRSGYVYGKLYGNSYKLYKIPIVSNNSNRDSNSKVISLDGIDIDTCIDCKVKQPGFRLWPPSIVDGNSIVISDISDSSIKYYDTSTLVLQKQIKVNNIDNIAIGGINKNIIYTTEYDKRAIPNNVKDWKMAMGTDPPRVYKKVNKDFIVIKNGNIIFRKKIGLTRGLRASNVIIGGNSDVFVTTSKGLTRVSSK